MDKQDKKDKIKKVKVEIEENILKKLFDLKNYGDTYSDVIKRLLEI